MSSKQYHINITEYLDENINKYSNRIAVIDNEKTISFAELYAKIIEFAKVITTLCDSKKNQIIAVLLPKSISSVIADLAILYSGNAYMNLDVNNPSERLLSIINQVNPTLIISSSKYNFENDTSDLQWCNYFDNDYIKPQLSDSLIDCRCSLIDTDPACVINTSGSTGVPKSVILNHKSFIDFIESVRTTGFISENEIIGSLSPVVFDIYSFELCMMMTWGSTMVVLPEIYAAFPVKLLQLMFDQKVTYAFWVPTIMVNIANMDLLSKIDLSSLKMVWFAGEVFPTAKFNYWKNKLPDCRFVNFYGPIEITLDCLYHEVVENLSDDCPIPIGKPFRNTSVFLLDDDNKLVADKNLEGELCIRGSSLAMGYYNNKEKTDLAFVQNPLNNSYQELIYRTGDIASLNDNGDYVFRGRKDTLVKRMGYRIELSEIEHVVVDNLKIAKNCCVLYHSSTKDIILVYESTSELSLRDIQMQLRKVLPKYMIPTKAYWLSILPRNANGKIDRNLLKQQLL